MLSKIHEKLGFNGPPPRWIRQLKLPAVVIAACAVLGLPALQTPGHFAFHEAKIVTMTTEQGGVIIGDTLVVELPDGRQISTRSDLRMPEAKISSVICLQELRRSEKSRPVYRTAHSRRCGGDVTVTYYKLP